MLRIIFLLGLTLPIHAAENAALVAAISGAVTIDRASPVAAYDWLAEGAVLHTGPKSSATVILLNGHRFELGAGARATVGTARLSAIAGPVHELAPVPPIPKPVPLAMATGTAAATYFRGAAQISAVCPPDGTATLAGPVKLSFQKVDAAAAYEIAIEDADGNQIAQQTTKSTEITVPLQPGGRYFWRIRAIGAAGVVAQSQTRFVTLSDQQIQARQSFADGIRALPDGRALLAEVDLANGLVCEAIDGFRAALKLTPSDPAIERRLAQAEQK